MKNRNFDKKITLVIILIMLSLGSFIGFLVWDSGRSNKYAYENKAANGIINARTKDEIQTILNRQVSEGMFNVSINSNPIFKTGSSKGNLWIENIPNNKVDLEVDIKLKDKKETSVFKTKKIKPNQNIQNEKLDLDLDKGNYPAVAHFKATDPKDGKLIGNANVNITLSVQN